MSDFYLDYYIFDNSRVYLQGDEKPPKGAIVHKGTRDPDAKWYESNQIQHIYLSNDVLGALRYIKDTGKFPPSSPDTVHLVDYGMLSQVGLLYTEDSGPELSDEGDEALQGGNIYIKNRIDRENFLNESPYAAKTCNQKMIDTLVKCANGYDSEKNGELPYDVQLISLGCISINNTYEQYFKDDSEAYKEIKLYYGEDADKFFELYKKVINNEEITDPAFAQIVQSMAANHIFGLKESKLKTTQKGWDALTSEVLPLPSENYVSSGEGLGHWDMIMDSPLDREAITNYKGFLFADMNRFLSYYSEDYRWTSKKNIPDTIVMLDNLMERCTVSKPMELWNGCSKQVAELIMSGEYKVGDIFQLDCYTSTSTDPNVAEGFAHRSKPASGREYTIKLMINQPSGSHCFSWGSNDSEKEVTLPRGVQLKIKEFHDYIQSDGELIVECDRIDGLNKADAIQADNSKIYLQDGDKPPKGAIVHKGPLDGRYYDPDERPVQYVHMSDRRRQFLQWVEDHPEGFIAIRGPSESGNIPNITLQEMGYYGRLDFGTDVQTMERIGLIYTNDYSIYRLTDEGKSLLKGEDVIGVMDRANREKLLSYSPFRSGVWTEQDLRHLSKYRDVPGFELSEGFPPTRYEDIADYTKFKSVGLVDHAPYTFYIVDEEVTGAFGDHEIYTYCKSKSPDFADICYTEGRAYAMDEFRKAYDAISNHRYGNLDLTSPVVQALIKDAIFSQNKSERIMLTEAGKKALKDGKYEYQLPKTQIEQSVKEETILGVDESKYPISDYFVETNTDITPMEMKAVIEYKFNMFTYVNNDLLRCKDTIEEGTNDVIACLDNLLSRTVIKDPCTVYNGCPTEVSNMMLSGEYAAGDIFQLDTFTSTSLDRDIAGMFSNNDVILKIDQPAGATGFFYGTKESEKEILYPRGTQLKIKNLRKVPRYHEFYGGLEKDGSLTWDTLTDEEKEKALEDGYCEVPTKEHNFDTLTPEEQDMMGKTIVECERISGIKRPEEVYHVLEGDKVQKIDRAEQEHLIKSHTLHTRTYPEGLKDALQMLPEGSLCTRWWAVAGDIVYELEAAGVFEPVELEDYKRGYKLSEVGKEVLKGTYDQPDGTIKIPPPKTITASVDDPEGHDDGRLSPRELIAMGDYKGYYFTGINQTLINNPDAERNTSDKYDYNEVLSTIAMIDHTIARCKLSEEVDLYNGASVSVSKMLLSGDVKEGDIFQLDTFTSTSLDEDVAEGFCSEIFNDEGKKISEGVVIKIHQPANSNCFYYGGEADALGEQEVLLPRNTQVKITKIDRKPFFTVVECERIVGEEVQADNSKVYLQGDEKPPKGVPVHKGPDGGVYYNTEDVPNTHVRAYVSERQIGLLKAVSESPATLLSSSVEDKLPQLGYKTSRELYDEAYALEKVGLIIKDSGMSFLSDDGEAVLRSGAGIQYIDRLEREEDIANGDIASGILMGQEITRYSIYTRPSVYSPNDIDQIIGISIGILDMDANGEVGLTDEGKEAIKAGKCYINFSNELIYQSLSDDKLFGEVSLDDFMDPPKPSFFGTLTPMEGYALEHYKRSSYGTINRALLNGDVSKDPDLLPMINTLDKILGRTLIRESYTSYNGASSGISRMITSGEVHEGDIFILDTYTSTTLKTSKAVDFSREVVLAIENPDNTTGFFFTTNDTEKEILLPRGTQLKIKSIRKIPVYDAITSSMMDGGLVWDTLSEENKQDFINGGYDVPTLDSNYSTLSEMEQGMMGKYLVTCERVSGIGQSKEVQADNSYKHYLQDGEKPKKGEHVHIGPRKGKYVMRDEGKPKPEYKYVYLPQYSSRSGDYATHMVNGGSEEDKKKIVAILNDNSSDRISIHDQDGKIFASIKGEDGFGGDTKIISDMGAVDEEIKEEVLKQMMDYYKAQGKKEVYYWEGWSQPEVGDLFKKMGGTVDPATNEKYDVDPDVEIVKLDIPDEYQSEVFRKDPYNIYQVKPNDTPFQRSLSRWLEAPLWEAKFYEVPPDYLEQHREEFSGKGPGIKDPYDNKPRAWIREGSVFYEKGIGGEAAMPYALMNYAMGMKGDKTLDLDIFYALTQVGTMKFIEANHFTADNGEFASEKVSSIHYNTAETIRDLMGMTDEEFYHEIVNADDKAKCITDAIWDRYGHLFDNNESAKENIYQSFIGDQFDEMWNKIPSKATNVWNQTPELKKIMINSKKFVDNRPIKEGRFGDYRISEDYQINVSPFSSGLGLESHISAALGFDNLTLLINGDGVQYTSVAPMYIQVGSDFYDIPRKEQNRRIYKGLGLFVYDRIGSGAIPHNIYGDALKEVKSKDEFGEIFAEIIATSHIHPFDLPEDSPFWQNMDAFLSVSKILESDKSYGQIKLRSHYPSAEAVQIKDTIANLMNENLNATKVREHVTKADEESEKLEPLFTSLAKAYEDDSELDQKYKEGKISSEEYEKSKSEYAAIIKAKSEEYNSLYHAQVSPHKEYIENTTKEISEEFYKMFTPGYVTGEGAIMYQMLHAPKRRIVVEESESCYSEENIKWVHNITSDFADWAVKHIPSKALKGVNLEVGLTDMENRSYCRDLGGGDNEIHLSLGAVEPSKTMAHEFGHAIEHTHPEIQQKAQNFLNARTFGEKKTKLADILPGSGYERDEVCKKDAFPDPYCGKIYTADSTELISMGLQYLYSAPGSFAQDDPEYFMFMIDVLRCLS